MYNGLIDFDKKVFVIKVTLKKISIAGQGVIQKKSASGSHMLPFVIFDKKVPFFSENGVILTYFWVTHHQKCPFLKIPDATLKF